MADVRLGRDGGVARPSPHMQPTITSAPRPALPMAGKLLAKQAEAIRLRTAQVDAA
jgi:hypothetical protein